MTHLALNQQIASLACVTVIKSSQMTLANLKTLCTHHDLAQRAILVTCIQESSPWNVIRAGDFLTDQAKLFLINLINQR